MRLIDADALEQDCNIFNAWDAQIVKAWLKDQPTIEAEPVTHCKDCIYFKPAHVKCADGTEKPYSDFQPEAFEPNFGLGVTLAYGINIGSQCMYNQVCMAGHKGDTPFYRKEDDFCSRAKRAKMDGGDSDGDQV